MSPNGTEFNGNNAVNFSYGPICRSSQDLKRVTSLLLGQFSEDPYCDNTPFDHKTYEGENRLRIAYLTHFPLVNTCDDSVKQLHMTIDSLRKNHELEPFTYEKL